MIFHSESFLFIKILFFVTDGNQKDVSYSPSKDLIACAYLEVEKKVKTAEAVIRAEVYDASMSVRRG